MKCRKCGAPLYEEIIDYELWFRCRICGTYIPSIMIKDGITSIVTQTPVRELLPRQGTKLSITLGALAGIEQSTTSSLASVTGQSTTDTAAQLTVLRGRGLVLQLDHKRGISGGSSWSLSVTCKMLLNI